MKNDYKNAFAVGLIVILMISAQGVEAKHPPKSKQLHFNHHSGGYSHHRSAAVFHQGRMFIFKNGVFYTRGNYGFREIDAPIGI
ncbi:MAG: hypothetical protein GY816_18140 [Cytophagales bacterium]|nr:hypothetical protein [Cytophagales bacterium]